MNNEFQADPIVEQVSARLPCLREALETTKARYIGLYDSVLLRLEGELYNHADQLEGVCLRIAREQNFEDNQDQFDDLWFRLNELFFEFGDRCLRLGVFMLDWECLTLQEDGSPSPPSDDEEIQSSDGEEVEINAD